MFKSFCNLRRNAIKALCVVSVAGAVTSCADDYKWDNENPTWLGSSIYEYLQTGGNYKTFIRLIDDLDYAEVLGKTGSKTLFVADDAAFENFFADNAWGVKNYDQLTLSQKKLLLNSAMINNAYLLEMMSSTPAGNGDNDEPVKGQCLRRETASDVTDSIPHLVGADIPVTYSPEDIDYWKRFRESDKGIYLALDATNPMITHFLAAQLASKNITNEDFEKITGKKRETNDAYIFDSKVLKQDITCQNGYINVLDKVLVPPQNMAEVLRTGENTKIFSHLLDRFSAPFYNETLTQRYRLIYGNDVDSVFQKRYFADRSQGTTLYSDRGTDPLNNPTGNTVFDTSSNKPLPFDPGWNQYSADARITKEEDMAVIFAPTDEKLMQYFFGEKGGGRFLVNAYAIDYIGQIDEDTKDYDLVYHALDQIPRQTIRALLNNLMKESFNSSVPSKFATIKNSAQDAMFDEENNYHTGNILDTKIANNGIIYLMNEVTTPAEYAAVSAPAYVETNKRIFNWAIQSAKLGDTPTNYYAYLLAMSSRFSFLVPNDDNFWYIDPLSFYSPERGTGSILKGRIYRYVWDEKTKAPKVENYEYLYDIANKTGEVGQLRTTETVSATTLGNRLKDMLETHTIIHEDNSESTGIDETQTGMECDQHYFITKNGAVLYAENAAQRAEGMTVKGGWQIANDTESKVIGFDDKSAQSNGYGNGFAYMIDQPLLPTIESVYSIMNDNPDFSEFLKLCNTDEEVLTEIGITSTLEKNRYKVFVNNKGIPCYDKNTGDVKETATNVRFFNNYRYTIYVPTNEAIEAAYANGLPSWEDIRNFLELNIEPEERTELTPEQEEARNIKAKAMCTAIVNFVKYHFQDNSVFADKPAITSTQYETATINSETGVYCKVRVSSNGNGSLSVQDALGHTRNVTSNKNLIARDYVTKGTASTVSNAIISSSSAVVHGIDGVLDYKNYEGGRYDSDWKSEAKARAYLNIFKLKE